MSHSLCCFRSEGDGEEEEDDEDMLPMIRSELAVMLHKGRTRGERRRDRTEQSNGGR